MILFPEKDSKISSLVEFLILLTLKKEGRLRGVDIINNLLEQFQNWKPQSGTIYPVLNRLYEKKGFVSLEGKYYQLTQNGEKILKEFLSNFIDNIMFIDNIFNYGRPLMNELEIMRSEQKLLQNHMPYLKDLIDTIPLIRPQLSGENSSEIFVGLRKIRDTLQTITEAIEKQIEAINEEEKIVRVKIK
jgi:DNA-binding PadR family transcriptional regulator